LNNKKRQAFSEIKKILSKVNEVSCLEKYIDDERVCVQKLLSLTKKRLNKQDLLFKNHQEMQKFEKKALDLGFKLIAGLDEVGRGSLAGPVLAAAVILPLGALDDHRLLGLNDSKQLCEKKRQHFFKIISEIAVSIGIGRVEPKIIDEINIYEASKLAMQKALDNLTTTPDFLLIDAMEINTKISQKKIVKGDALSLSIAAASVIAKVTRDNLMSEFAKKYPPYSFEKNVGYGTKLHISALKKYGATPLHRVTYAPVKEVL